MASGGLTGVEAAIEKIAEILSDYKASLSDEEFGSLVAQHLPNLGKSVDLDQKKADLRIDKDQAMGFPVYWKLIGEVAKTIKEEKK